MPLPYLLQSSLNEEISHIPKIKLQKAYRELSNLYRINRKDIGITLNSEERRISYAAARMPSTYETVNKVLMEIGNNDDVNIQTLIDVGAGPGTAAWASCNNFDSISKVTLIEQQPEMAALGKRLAINHPILKNANWLIHDAHKKISEIENADLVIASYSFNEIPETQQQSFLKALWEKTNQYLVIIDPGTPSSFLNLYKARNWFLENKINIIAPCPHLSECPAFKNQDWCHFSVRVQRTSLHRMLKDGEKGHEDEKYSYLIVAKNSPQTYNARIVRHPEIHSGHLKLTLCTKNGFEGKIYSKKDKEKYKKAKKAAWGDRFEL